MPLANLEELQDRKLSNTTKRRNAGTTLSGKGKKTGKQQPVQGNVPKPAKLTPSEKRFVLTSKPRGSLEKRGPKKKRLT